MTEKRPVDEDDSSSSSSSNSNNAEEMIPGALDGLVAELETKAAKYNLSRSNVKNILRHVMQSEEMVNLLRDELSAEEGQTQTGETSGGISSTAVFGSSSMRMTRQRFHQLAGDKVCPDLEVLLSRLPPAPSAPKSFFEVEFPEDDPEDAEYDPRLEDENDFDETLASPSNAATTPRAREDRCFNNETPATDSCTMTSNNNNVPETPTLVQTDEELIATRTRSRYPLCDFDLDAIAPLPPELHFDGDSLSPTPSTIRGQAGNNLLFSMPSQRCASPSGSTNPVDDEIIYAHFLATVFDSDESETNANNYENGRQLFSGTPSQTDEATSASATVTAPPSACMPERTLMSGTDEEQDDPDYNPLLDIDALLEFDPDEYAWDKRARIPKEEVRTLRKEAFADLPVHCHLLETVAEAANNALDSTGFNNRDEEAGPSTRTPAKSARKRAFPSSQKKKSKKSSTKKPKSAKKKANLDTSASSASSSSEEDSDETFVGVEDPALLDEGVPVFEETARKKTPDVPKFLPNEEQVLLLKEQMRKHVQILVQTYIMAGNAPEGALLSQQSVAFLTELETLRSAAENPERSCFNAFNLASALEFVEKWPPEAIGLPKPRFSQSDEIKKQQEKNLKNRVDRRFLLRPIFSCRQMDLMAFHCPALIYAGILPTGTEGFYDTRLDIGKSSKRVPWLPSEDDLLALGLEQFWVAGEQYREKANVIQKYLLPTKNVLNIRMRMKNVFYSVQYQNDTENPIKIFQQYGVAPQYESPVCNFCPEEVVPLRFLPRRCLPRWFLNRLDHWERENARNKGRFSEPGKVDLLADENETESQHDENSRPSSSYSARSNSGLEGEDDEIEFSRGTAEDSSSSSSDETETNNNVPKTQGDPSSSSTKQTPSGDETLVLVDNNKLEEEPPILVQSPGTTGIPIMEATSSVSLLKEGDDDLTTSRSSKVSLVDAGEVTPPRQQVIQQSSPDSFSISSSERDEMDVEQEEDSNTLSMSRLDSDTLCSPDRVLRQKTYPVESSPSVGHGGFSSVDEEAAVFLTPVKNYVTNRPRFDSDPRATTNTGASLVDATSSDSVPANQRLSTSQQAASPLRARQPLLAKLLASLTPKVSAEQQSPLKREKQVIAVVIAPISSSTPSTSISPAVRPKRVRRASTRAEGEVEPRKLRLIAPAPVVNPPPKSLLDASELSMISQVFASPSPSKSANNKVVDNIRARALKQSRFAAVKRSLQMSTNGNSNANPPQFDSDSCDPPTKTVATSENNATAPSTDYAAQPPVRRRQTAVKRRHPPRLNEKQRQRLIDMFSASNSARLVSDSMVDCALTGSALPISGLGGTSFPNTFAESELANTYLELLESSLPYQFFFDVLRLFNSCYENQNSVDVKWLYFTLKNLLNSSGRLDLMSHFASFLTARQAYDCDCYQNFAEFDAACEFLTQHQAAFGGRNSLKSLQSLTRLISSSKQANFSAMESEFAQILGNQTCLLEQLASFFSEDRPIASRFYPDSDNFETIDLTSNEGGQSSCHTIEFESVRFPASSSKYGTDQCPCDCHSSGVSIRVSAVVANQLADFKRHCRRCGISVSDGKLYIPDSRNGFRLKRVAVLNDKFQQLLKPYTDATKLKLVEVTRSSSNNIEQQENNGDAPGNTSKEKSN